jgi:hypothetical protein
MAFGDIDCPIRYPNKCNLLPEEYEALVHKDKYVVFLMYQFQRDDDYVRRTVGEILASDMYCLLDAKDQPAVGVKFCKICRLAQAADFGVAVLTPLNYNVFLEMGTLFGLERPVLLLSNPEVCPSKELPFDLTHEMLIEFSGDAELREGMKRELPMFISKVGKTVEHRGLRDALRDELAEINVNRQLLVRYGDTPSPALRQRSRRLEGLLEREDLPSPVFDTGLYLLGYVEQVNALIASPVGMSPKSHLYKNWLPLRDEVLRNLAISEKVIERSLAKMKQQKPFS